MVVIQPTPQTSSSCVTRNIHPNLIKTHNEKVNGRWSRELELRIEATEAAIQYLNTNDKTLKKFGWYVVNELFKNVARSGELF